MELQHNAAQVLLLNASTLSALWGSVRKAARQAPDVPILGCLCSSGITQHLPPEVVSYLIKPITRDGLHAAMESMTSSIKRVLIVDDNADTRELLSLYVQAYDVMVDVVLAENGEQALALLRETRPDLVFLDLVMGEIDGWQVLEAKQKDEELEDIPVIIITAQDPSPEPPRSRVLLTTVGDGIPLEKLVDGAAVLSAVMSGTP
jgi:CheY-like chemotaxis protein